MTPDVNVLLAALRSDHPHHSVARAWLDGAVGEAARGVLLRLQPMVTASLLRLAIHPKIFVDSTPLTLTLRFIDALLAAPGVEQPRLGAEWPIFRSICADKAQTPNDIPDIWLAAAVIQQGEHLTSFDAGFSRLLKSSQFTRLRI